MAPDQSEDWARLAAQIEQRLDDLALQWKDIPGRGGPSTAKVRELRNGSSRTLTRSKRRDLERALEWEHGSVDWVLAGRDPRAILRAPTSPRAPEPEVWLHSLTTQALWTLYTDVSAEIRRRIPDDAQDWRDGWSTPKGEDPGMGLHEDGE